MAIQMISTGDGKAAIGSDSVTGERGLLVKMLNKTSATTVKGTLVSASTATDKGFILNSNMYDTIGVVQEAGVADAAEAWVWMPGSICQVLYKENTGSTRGYVCLGDTDDGRASDIDVPTSTPGQNEHFREVGHVLETKAAPGEGNSNLVLVATHYN